MTLLVSLVNYGPRRGEIIAAAAAAVVVVVVDIAAALTE